MTEELRLGGGDVFAHAEQCALQTGQDVESVLESMGLAPPDIPEDGKILWDWFWELSEGRGSNGFGWLPLTWTDMDAWARIAGIDLQPWQAGIIRAMDRAWLTEMVRQNKRKNNG